MRNRTWIFLGCLSFMCVAPSVSQERAQPEEDPFVEAVRAELEKSIEWNDYFISDREEPLEPRIVMRWGNQVRGLGSVVGLTVVWIDRTRPHVIASIYPWDGTLTQQYDLVTREPNVVAKRDGQTVWRPESTGLEFRPIPDAPPPAASAARRRLQMKDLASQFEVTMTGWTADNSDRQELRMLPQWLLRYGEEVADVLDGALFAYVIGTDPETVLVIEAFRTTEGKHEWQYAFVRQTSGGLVGRWRDDVVWTAEKMPDEDDPSQPHFRLLRPLRAELRQGQ